jgi:hypothetical protein
VSTRTVKSIKDFARHRMPIELVCYCGHVATLPFLPVVQRFVEKGWPVGLEMAMGYFRCRRRGSSPRHIGPVGR